MGFCCSAKSGNQSQSVVNATQPPLCDVVTAQHPHQCPALFLSLSESFCKCYRKPKSPSSEPLQCVPSERIRFYWTLRAKYNSSGFRRKSNLFLQQPASLQKYIYIYSVSLSSLYWVSKYETKKQVKLWGGKWGREDDQGHWWGREQIKEVRGDLSPHPWPPSADPFTQCPVWQWDKVRNRDRSRYRAF